MRSWSPLSCGSFSSYAAPMAVGAGTRYQRKVDLMATKRKSEFAKASGDTRRAVVRLVRALPVVTRLNWRNVFMPWRLVPMPIGMALIALVALAMILDTGSDANADTLEGQGVMIGADTVSPGTRCEEDEVITYRVLMGGQGVGCVHYEYVVMEFIGDCLIGNAEHGDNLASYHLRDPEFRSWCDAMVDDSTDGMVSLSDWLIDTSSGTAPTPSATMTATAIDGTVTATPAMPQRLPSAGRSR